MQASRQILIGATRVDVTDRVVSWESGMAIDFDGAPNAYAPHGSGLPALDALANAGSPGKWWGLACAESGEPFVQRAGKWAGYYVSTTALVNPFYKPNDARRYVDATTVPYVSVPKAVLFVGVRKGDLCLVTRGAVSCAAIVADVGPPGRIGEGSPALAARLGIPAGMHGGCDGGVSYRVFIGSLTTPPWPRAQADIEAAVADIAARTP